MDTRPTARLPLWSAQWESPLGPLELWASPRGLVRLSFSDGTRPAPPGWAQRHFGSAAPQTLAPSAPPFAEAVAQLAGYFAGQQRVFTLPLDLRGTAFQLAVWQAVGAVPWGETRSYHSIAALIGRPRAVRAVGAANGANPLSIIIPCHRLIGSDGQLRGYAGGLARKQALLALEA